MAHDLTTEINFEFLVNDFWHLLTLFYILLSAYSLELLGFDSCHLGQQLPAGGKYSLLCFVSSLALCLIYCQQLPAGGKYIFFVCSLALCLFHQYVSLLNLTSDSRQYWTITTFLGTMAHDLTTELNFEFLVNDFFLCVAGGLYAMLCFMVCDDLTRFLMHM